MKTKLLLLIIVGIFLISLTSAISEIGPFKKGDCINLIQTCDNCTYVNISSITFPNSTVLNINNFMTKTGVDYNYSFCYTLNDGDYYYNTCGNKNGIFQCESIKFSINPSGFKSSSFLSETFLIVLVLLALLLIILGIQFSITYLGFIGSLFFILAGVYTTIYGFGGVTNLYTRGAGMGILALGIFFMFVSAYDEYKPSGGEDN